MASQRQIEANRRNAQRSTGPKTPDGKAAVARNALRHGLRAREVVLHQEDPAAFAELLSALEAELAPAGAHQQNMVLRVASAIWRLLRHSRIEHGFLLHWIDSAWVPRPPNSSPRTDAEIYTDVNRALGSAFRRFEESYQGLAILNRYENNLNRAFCRALDELIPGKPGAARVSSKHPEPPPPPPATPVTTESPRSSAAAAPAQILPNKPKSPPRRPAIPKDPPVRRPPAPDSHAAPVRAREHDANRIARPPPETRAALARLIT